MSFKRCTILKYSLDCRNVVRAFQLITNALITIFSSISIPLYILSIFFSLSLLLALPLFSLFLSFSSVNISRWLSLLLPNLTSPSLSSSSLHCLLNSPPLSSSPPLIPSSPYTLLSPPHPLLTLIQPLALIKDCN